MFKYNLSCFLTQNVLFFVTRNERKTFLRVLTARYKYCWILFVLPNSKIFDKLHKRGTRGAPISKFERIYI